MKKKFLMKIENIEQMEELLYFLPNFSRNNWKFQEGSLIDIDIVSSFRQKDMDNQKTNFLRFFKG